MLLYGGGQTPSLQREHPGSHVAGGGHSLELAHHAAAVTTGQAEVPGVHVCAVLSLAQV